MSEPKGENMHWTTLKILLFKKKKVILLHEHPEQKEKATANFGGG